MSAAGALGLAQSRRPRGLCGPPCSYYHRECAEALVYSRGCSTVASGMLELPEELLLCILSHLDPRARCRVALCCRKLARIAGDVRLSPLETIPARRLIPLPAAIAVARGAGATVPAVSRGAGCHSASAAATYGAGRVWWA